MSSPIQNEIAQSILAKEKRKAQAKAVLNRPDSAVPAFLVTMLVVGLGVFLHNIDEFKAPTWVVVLLIASASSSLVNMMDLLRTRRQLEAAITLLQDQQEPDK